MKFNKALYIHIPFCTAICDYCDFYSVLIKDYSGSYIDAYIEAVLKDIKHQIELFDINEISTVYIGGGTPSALGGEHIRYLLNGLNLLPGFSPIEFSVEANPESTNEDFLSACREGGVTRISLGVQSFHEPSRKAVNRAGKAGSLDEQLTLVSKFYPGSFSVDLIAGLPFQTKQIIVDDIEKLLKFSPAHVSLYSLSAAHIATKFSVHTDVADDIWLSGRDVLEQAGYKQYEVSNFSQQDKYCLHNIRYWRMEGWLGAGAAASGTLINKNIPAAKRYTFPADIIAYINSPYIENANCEDLDKGILLREMLLMGFRYCEGPDADIFKQRFGISIEECIPETITRWRKRGFFSGAKPATGLMLFLNSFLSEAFAELDIRGL